MAAVVTATTNSILVDFGDGTRGAWRKDQIVSITLEADDVLVYLSDGEHFQVSNSSTGNHIVIETVGGASPSSLADLFTKLSALIA